MKKTKALLSAAVIAVLTMATVLSVLPVSRAQSAAAQTQTGARTLTFAVDKMTCAACPITVRKAMERVEGVKSVSVDFKSKTATVTFDPSVATPEQIGTASANAGYPATPES